jgi:hypothetical protein
MFETKATYIETMLQAAITHQLHKTCVSALVSTVLSVMKQMKVCRTGISLIAKPLLNDLQLLQSVLGMKWPEPSHDIIASIAHQLYDMNPGRNSTPSILIGVLGLYHGSTSAADLALMDILKSIDKHRCLNLLSSSETWNAFRSNRSRSHVESLSSSLDNPFPLIDSDEMNQSILYFKTDECKGGRNVRRDAISSGSERKSLDPEFWLSVVSYCLEKCRNSSELTVLLENSAIGFTFVCLSSENEEVRKTAGSILLKWERLCEANQFSRK